MVSETIDRAGFSTLMAAWGEIENWAPGSGAAIALSMLEEP